MRKVMRVPLGELLPDSISDSEILGRVSGLYVITVGDRTTERLLSLGVVPSLQIVDGLERREGRAPPDPGGARVVRVENPAGHITEQGMGAVQEALSGPGPVRIMVSGEEDLLAVPACAYAPDGAVVLYGQPGEGLVIVRINPQVRNMTAAMLRSMG